MANLGTILTYDDMILTINSCIKEIYYCNLLVAFPRILNYI